MNVPIKSSVSKTYLNFTDSTQHCLLWQTDLGVELVVFSAARQWKFVTSSNMEDTDPSKHR